MLAPEHKEAGLVGNVAKGKGEHSAISRRDTIEVRIICGEGTCKEDGKTSQPDVVWNRHTSIPVPHTIGHGEERVNFRRKDEGTRDSLHHNAG